MFHPSARVDSVMYILNKVKSDTESRFIKLNNIYEGIRYDSFVVAYDSLIKNTRNSNIYSIPQSKLKVIETWPFIYWISDDFREKFGADSLGKYFNIKNGLQTGNNNRFLRFWWEIASNKVSYSENSKWVLYCKGGPHNKWFGNLWTTVNVLETNSSVPTKGYLKEGVNFSGSSSKGASFRYVPEGNMFDNDAPLIFPKGSHDINYLLGFINSELASYIVSCLNPTVKTQVGDIKRIPFTTPTKKIEVEVSHLASLNTKIKQQLCSYSLIELNHAPIARVNKDEFKAYFNYENHLLTQTLINEAIINKKIFEVYNLTQHDRAVVVAKEGESIGGLAVSSHARIAYLTDLKIVEELPLNASFDFIESLPTKEFTLTERETIESDFQTLYQSNNNLEQFCKRHQVNPINVWYWFKQSKIIPKQRMNTLAMEFLADMIREILMEDEDGIISLMPNSGGKQLLDLIEEKFYEKGFTSAQYSNFDSVLGRPLNDYINKNFFAELSDHLNLFMYLPKTPFIWHLTSGPEQGFDCYIIIYKWSRDNLMRLRSVYIENRERALQNRQSDIAENESASAQNEKDRIFKQLKEIEVFKGKIDELLEEGYNPILDDGVGKNIAPLQQKKMLAYDVLNAGQLKKYLNADW
ncbi:hypothetical protein AADH33_04580 [Psychrobacter sp. KFRI-CH2-11]|uniref:hypothetical protein n=1 Tax=Psychrobacter sp. KFRI-CH2-11 TaxID=3156079 RepID=UPI003254FADF